jgi:hypothetical protein
MSKFTALIFILALRIFFQPSESKKDIAPFAKPSHFREFTSQVNNARETITIDFINKDNEIMNADLSKTKNY